VAQPLKLADQLPLMAFERSGAAGRSSRRPAPGRPRPGPGRGRRSPGPNAPRPWWPCPGRGDPAGGGTGRSGRCPWSGWLPWRPRSGSRPATRGPLRVRPERCLPADSLFPGHTPAQEARCAAVGNWPMSGPISATMTSAARRSTPGMVSNNATCSAYGAISCWIRAESRATASSRSSTWARSWATSSPWWSVRNRPASAARTAGSLLRSRTLGQRRQHRRVVGAADQGFQHGPAGGPDDVGGHAGQLGSRRPPRTLSSRCTSRQRSWIWVLRYRVSSRSSRIGRGDLEAGPDQPVLDQLGNPGRVGHIRLAARHVPQVGRVQQPALDLILQQLPDRLPVAAGRLHPHPGHPEAGQPLGQHHQPGGGRGEPARLAVAPTMASGTRTQAVTESLCTSSPAQRATNVSTCSPPPPGRRLVAIRRSLSQGNLSLVLVATVRGARGSHVRLISGLSAPRERRRRPDDRHSFIRRGWPAPAMGGLSEIDGRPPCYPAFALVVRLRKSYKDGVNWRSSCCAGPWPRTSRHDPDVESVGASSLSVIPSGVMVNSRTWGWCRLARVFSTVRVRRMAAG
jgi:hypothetical protein